MFDFVPAVREEVNEREALRTLSTDVQVNDESMAVKPLVEITEENNMNNISHYSDSYEEVFVDFPRYLTERDSSLKDDVETLVGSFSDPTSFHFQTDGDDYTPVVSGNIEDIDHSGLDNHLENLSQEFDRLCVRIFIPVEEYSDEQREQIESIFQALRPTDAVIADVVDVRDISQGIRQNIEYIASQIRQQDLYILDMFEPRGDVNYNYGLVMGKYTGVDGIGDFVIETRFPQEIPGPAFANIPDRIRQYDNQSHQVDTWKSDESHAEAINEMLQTGDLDPDHCPYCEELYSRFRDVQSDPNRSDLNVNMVKQLRMNHYMYSVLNDEFPDLAAARDAQDFDSDGYQEII